MVRGQIDFLKEFGGFFCTRRFFKDSLICSIHLLHEQPIPLSISYHSLENLFWQLLWLFQHWFSCCTFFIVWLSVLLILLQCDFKCMSWEKKIIYGPPIGFVLWWVLHVLTLFLELGHQAVTRLIYIGSLHYLIVFNLRWSIIHVNSKSSSFINLWNSCLADYLV